MTNTENFQHGPEHTGNQSDSSRARSSGEPLRVLDLFSGIGGFSLAAHWAGMETAAFCECDQFCQKVLAKHWPTVPIVGDIKNLRGDEFGRVDIVSGGFPCQPFSLAGKRAGTQDDRFLWPEMLRVIQTAGPAWVIGENVPGIVGLALDGVLSDLEGIGYEVQPLIIPACAVDAPHRRDRVWIVAHSECEQNNRERRDSEFGRNTVGWNTETAQRENENANTDGVIGQGEDVAHANTQPGTTGSEQSVGGRTPQAARLGECGEALADAQRSGRDGRTNDQARRVLPGWEAFEGCGTTGTTWESEPGLGWMVNGLPGGMVGYWPPEPTHIPRTARGIPYRTAKLKGYGNAIVPEVAFRILRIIAHIERG